MTAKLVLTHAGKETARVLRAGTLRVGFDPSADLVIPDPSVSREHAEFKPVGGVWKVVDLESASGTRVNGRFVNQQSLIHGDVVEIGPARILFLDDGAVEVPVPAPVGAAAPVIPVPAPAPIPPPAAAPPAAAPLPAPAPPPPAPPPAASAAPAPAAALAAPAARPAARAPSPSLPRPTRRRTKAGFEQAILWGLIGLFVVALLFVLSGGLGEKPTVNVLLAARMKGMNREGRFEEVLAMEKEADPADGQFMVLVEDQVTLARNSLRAQRIGALEKKSGEYILWQIQKWHQDHRRDAEGLIRRYDEYLERFPGTAHWQDIARKREELAGGPSPVYLRMIKDGTLERIPPPPPPQDPAELTMGMRLRLATDESRALADERRFAEARAVYERLLREHVAALPEFEAVPYRSEVDKRMEKIEKEAYKAFELLEQEAFTLSESDRLDEAEALYRTAMETYGLKPILDRCRVELDRIQETRGRR